MSKAYTTTIPATLDEVTKAYAFLSEVLDSHAIPPKVALRINVALDEAISNVARYAYDHPNGFYTIKVLVEEHRLEIEIRDKGKEYNPLLAKEPDVHAPLEDRGIGGYGVFIIKKFMNSVHYKHEADENVLTFDILF